MIWKLIDYRSPSCCYREVASPANPSPKRPLSPPRETHLVTGTVVFCTEPTYCRAKMPIGGCKWCDRIAYDFLTLPRSTRPAVHLGTIVVPSGGGIDPKDPTRSHLLDAQ